MGRLNKTDLTVGRVIGNIDNQDLAEIESIENGGLSLLLKSGKYAGQTIFVTEAEAVNGWQRVYGASDTYDVWATDRNGNDGVFVSDVDRRELADNIANGLAEYGITAWVEAN